MIDVRSFVLLGQGGRLTSAGMLSLGEPLSRYGQVTIHGWDESNYIIGNINSGEHKNVAVIGYSLGANALGWIGSHTTRPIDLGIGYDPSRKSQLAKWTFNDGWVERCPNFKKLICYYNPDTWYFGGAKYDRGEIVPISTPHLMVPSYPGLHQRTILEVEKLSHG